MNSPTVEAGKRLLIIGPLPPPMGGSGVTLKALLGELGRYPAIRVEVINTSPYSDPKKSMTGFKLEKVYRMVVILSKYLQLMRNIDIVIVFANPLFLFTIVPILQVMATMQRKKFYIKPVGGDLDNFLESRPTLLRNACLTVMNGADGIFAQTKLLQKVLLNYGCKKVYYIPGFRTRLHNLKDERPKLDRLRLIFIAHITREKGALVLLEALQRLRDDEAINVTCDFYGLAHDDIKDEFFNTLNLLPCARYCGVIEAGSAAQILSEYDVLILPTFFSCEGHPGVIIEAMQAGIAVIATSYRSIPELVTDGENGILIPIKNSQVLASAIRWCAENREKLRQMGETNYAIGEKFSAEYVTAQILAIILDKPLVV
jgi:glycosyltransferase involved in cell wall biosynthesis